jgi:hypothetical protein
MITISSILVESGVIILQSMQGDEGEMGGGGVVIQISVKKKGEQYSVLLG